MKNSRGKDPLGSAMNWEMQQRARRAYRDTVLRARGINPYWHDIRAFVHAWVARLRLWGRRVVVLPSWREVALDEYQKEFNNCSKQLEA